MARNCFEYVVTAGIEIESSAPCNEGPTSVNHGVRPAAAYGKHRQRVVARLRVLDQCPGCIRYSTAVTTASQRNAVTRTRMVLSRLLQRRPMRA